MEQWLKKHAATNVWCRPAADARLLVGPRRLTPKEGDIYGLNVSEHSILMPKPDTWFHVFQVGGFDPAYLGFTQPWAGWKRADSLVNAHNVAMIVYNTKGRTFPLSMVWLRVISNGNFIIATEAYDQQINFGEDDLNIRFYNGAFNKSPNWNVNYRTFTNSKIVRTGDDIVNFITEYTESTKKPGYTFAYVNGYRVKALTLENVKLWDYVEYFHDGLVREVVEFNANALPSFVSLLDKKKKYILHPPKNRITQDFINDVEIYIFHKDQEGRYFHVNQANALRQLTHRDFSIDSTKLVQIAENEGWKNLSEVRVRLYIRRSGIDRPLIYEANRIHELYKLKDADILSAMTGKNAVVDCWRADKLEQCPYSRLMAAMPINITKELATDAYGYNSISSLVGMTPQDVIVADTGNYVTLPPLLARNCTVYEYDADGLLLGFYLHADPRYDQYKCQNANAVRIEAVEGRGSDQLDINWDAATYKVESGFNYRFYVEKLLSGVGTGEFEDVTGTDAYRIDLEGNVIWEVDQTRRKPVVWKDSRFTAYEVTDDGYDGTYKFSIQTYHADKKAKVPLMFQHDTLEIWMNGKSLISGLDYVVKWPQVIICNKEYLHDITDYHKPKIIVRGRNMTGEYQPPKFGYVIGGMLSNNTRFDVRDDKVVRISVAGAMKSREDVIFREDQAIALKNVENGMPYVIDDPLIPLRNVPSYSTYVMRGLARDVDQVVEDYMSIKIPQGPALVHNPIPKKHRLISPLLNKLVHDLINEILIPEEDPDKDFISGEEMDRIMENYKYLIDYDPVVREIDTRYVEIHPHDGETLVLLRPLHYSIIERANKTYLNDQVVINKLINVQV